IGTVARRPIYTITAPVQENGQVVLFLNLSLELSGLNDLLKENIEPGRIAGILDRRNNFMARTQHFDETVGRPAPASFRQQASKADGLWRGVDSEGELVRGGYAKSKVTGWSIFVSLPEKDIQATLRETLWTVGVLGALLVSAAILIAYGVGGRLAGSIGALAAQAAALGR